MRKVWVVAVLCLAAVLASMSLSLAGESGYANVVTVSSTGADFTSVSAAVNSITDASDTNRYCVKVQPGTYYGEVVCKPYVDIVGASRNSVVLTYDQVPYYGFPPSIASTLRICRNVHIADMTIKATGVGGIAIMGDNTGADTLLENLSVISEGIGITGTGAQSDLECRESAIDRWTTVRSCSIRAKIQAAGFGDDTAAYNCVFNIEAEGNGASILGVEAMGNTIIRDCQINIYITGATPTEVGGYLNVDTSTPMRLERTSIHVQVCNSSAACPVFGVKTGLVDQGTGASTEIDHCSIGVANSGSGTTYDIINASSSGEHVDTTTVFATKYNTSRTYGTITHADGG